MNNLSAIHIIWYRDLLRFWADKIRLIGSFLIPCLFLIVFGTGIASKVMDKGVVGGFDYIAFIYPGMIGMVVLINCVMASVSMVWDREFGFLKEVLVAPISRTAVALGKALAGATLATSLGIVMLVFLPFAEVSPSAGGVFALIGVMFVLALSLTSMGLYAASRIRTVEAFAVVMQSLMFPMTFLSTTLFPAESLPSWLGTVIKFNPFTYGVDGMRQALLGPEGAATFGIELFGYRMPIILDVVVVALFGLIMGALAVRSFRVQE